MSTIDAIIRTAELMKQLMAECGFSFIVCNLPSGRVIISKGWLKLTKDEELFGQDV